jgi:hypothetical protein
LLKTTGQRWAAALGLLLVVLCVVLWRAGSKSGKAGSPADPPAIAPASGPAENAAPAPARAPAASTGAAGQRPPAAAGPLSAAELAHLDETRLMARLRAAAGSDPALAVQLAREGNRRFPDSAAAPERASILIHALAGENLGTEARGEAENMVNHYPDSEWVREIERFTGAHRHRNIRVNDAGTLEYR